MPSSNVLGYYVVNLGTGTVLDLAGGKINHGTPIQGYQRVNRGDSVDWRNQTWSISADTDLLDKNPTKLYFHMRGNNYRIWALDLEGGSAANGTPIRLWDYRESSNQLWIKEDVRDGIMRFKNAASGTYLDLESGGNGARVRGWQFEETDRQLWVVRENVEPAPPERNPVAKGPAYIINAAFGTVLDLPGGRTDNGNHIHGFTKSPNGDGRENQTWVIVYQGMKLDRHTYSIRHFKSGVVLDLAAGVTLDYTPVSAWKWHNGGNQLWYMEKLGENKYRFKNSESGTYLHLPNSGDGVKVGGVHYQDTDCQVWMLEHRTDVRMPCIDWLGFIRRELDRLLI